MKNNKKIRITRTQIIIVSVLAVLAIIGVVTFNNAKETYSKEGQITHFIETLEKGDEKEVAEMLTTNDAAFEITAESVRPYLNYMEESSGYLDSLDNDLNRYGEKGNLSVVQNGKIMNMFDKYEFVLEPVYLELHTNHKDTAFLIDGVEVDVSDSDNYSVTVGPYAPDEYEITAAATINGFEFTNSAVANLIQNYEGTPFIMDLPLDGDYFRVSSDVPDWNVRIDETLVGTLDTDGKGEFGPILWEKGLEVYAEKEFPSGIITTEPQIIGDLDEIIQISYVEPVHYRMISMLVFDLYFNIMNHLQNSDNIEDRAYTELADLLVDGDKNPIYQQTIDVISQNKTDTEAYDIRYNHGVAGMTRTDIDKYEITLEITEQHSYPRRSDQESTRTAQLYVATLIVTDRDEEGVPSEMMMESIEVGDE